MRSHPDHRLAPARDPALERAEADIAETRKRVALSITELHGEITRSLDWREWVRRKPMVAVGLAVGVGLLLGRWRRT